MPLHKGLCVCQTHALALHILFAGPAERREHFFHVRCCDAAPVVANAERRLIVTALAADLDLVILEQDVEGSEA